MELVRALRCINRRNPLASRCRTYIMDSLFTHDFMVLTDKGKEMEMSPQYRNFFYKRYRKFSMDAIDCIMTMGFIPVSLVQASNKHYYPIVPAEGTYVVEVGYDLDTEKLRYRVWRPKIFWITGGRAQQGHRENAGYSAFVASMAPTAAPGCSFASGARDCAGAGGVGGQIFGGRGVYGSGRSQENWFVDESIGIIDGLGYDPSVFGEINSPLRAILEDLDLTNTLGDRLKESEWMMTNPVHLLQYHKDKDPDSNQTMTFNTKAFNYDGDEFTESVRGEMEMTQKQIHAISRKLDAARRARELRMREYGCSTEQEKVTEELMATENLVPFPKGLEHVKGEGLERFVGNKYIPVRELCDDNLSAIYGIPLAIMRNVGNLRGNQQEQTNIWRQTLIKYAKMLGDILTISFNEAYIKDEKKLEGNLFPKKPVVDDTKFNRVHQAKDGKARIAVLPDATGIIPPPPDAKDIFKNANGVLFLTPDDYLKNPDGEAVTNQNKLFHDQIRDLIEENKKYKQMVKDLEQDAHEQKQGRGKAGSGAGGDDDSDAATGKRKRLGTKRGTSRRLAKTDSNSVGVVIRLNVTSFMDAKLLKHAVDAGAIDLPSYQRYLRNRLNVPGAPANLTQTGKQILAQQFLAPGSKPPREDAMEPESENLGNMAKGFQKDKKVPPGVLLDIAQKDGDVREYQGEMEREKEQKHNEEKVEKKRKKSSTSDKSKKKAKKE